MEHSQSSAAVLPASIVSPTDVARLVREIELVDSFFTEAKIRQSGESVAMPRLSKIMDQYVSQNQFNLLNEDDRSKIISSLSRLSSDAPIMHISFSVDPPGSYVQKIVTWIRQNIDANTLVTVGLQPNIGAGCVVRTTNKIFDLSLREYFSDKRQFFIDKLHTATAEMVKNNESIEGDIPVSVATEASVKEAPVEGATDEIKIIPENDAPVSDDNKSQVQPKHTPETSQVAPLSSTADAVPVPLTGSTDDEATG